MVVGNGLVATAFDYYYSSDEILIYASGISNSKSGKIADYHREREMFLKYVHENKKKTIVYFSTTSINDPELKNTPYVLHKKEMEELVKMNSGRYQIFRLSNLAGKSGNKNTILNFFNENISLGIPFECWKNAERNIIDIDDVFEVINYILNHKLYENEIVNIANIHNYPVTYIINQLEIFHNKSAKMIMVDKGTPFTINVEKMVFLANILNLKFNENYFPELLKKYFSVE